MPAPKDRAPRDGERTPEPTALPVGSSVERSLEDFIARANTTLAPVSPEAAPKVLAMGTRRRNGKRTPGTLVVLGPKQQVAEETEIVTRVSPEDLRPARKSSWFSLRLGLAFVAGAALVLVATHMISGSGPKPVRPTAPTPPPVVITPAPAPVPPPLIVQPIPAPEPPAAAAEPAVAAEPPPAAEVKPVSEAAPPRKAPPKKARASAKPAAPAKKPSGLVDPFAN